MGIIEDDELRELFKAETEEHTQKLEEGLLHLEKQPDDRLTIEELLREAHSLKGAARMLGVTDVESVAHRFEDMLKEAYRGETQLTPERIDRMEWALDALRKMGNEAVTGKPSGVPLADTLTKLDIRKAETAEKPLPAKMPPSQAEISPPEAMQPDEPPPAVSSTPEPVPETEPALSPAPGGTQDMPENHMEMEAPLPGTGMIEDEELRNLFKAETEEHTQKLEERLLHLENKPDDRGAMEEALREAHSLKGAARMLGVTNMETVAHRFEDMLKAAYRGETRLTSEKTDRLEWALDVLRKIANEAVTGKPCGIPVAEVLATLDIKETGPAKTPSPKKEKISRTETRSPEPKPDEAPPVQPEAVPTPRFHEPSNEEAESLETPAPPDEGPVPNIAPGMKRPGIGGNEGTYQISTIRVEPKKLDILMTHVGELTVEKTHIERHLSETEDAIALWEEISRVIVKNQAGVDEHFDGYVEKMGTVLYQLRQAVFEDCAALNRITDGLEDGIRVLRLLPLSTVFNLFARTVRDLSRELSKEVNLVIEGGNTTADKHLIEMIKDPLMHLIRNAVHHGIENPDERERNGKPPASVIRIKGHRTATHIVIEVEDDGKGLNPEGIRKAALRKKLFQKEELTAMSDDRVRALIFNSGFSTSAMVTDISGRGVGLDVVKTNVERLKGTIDVNSMPGQGCRFSIRLPVTLATTRVFLIVAGGRKYALPVEFVRMVRYVSFDDVFHVEDRETIAMHGEAISVAWLEDLLDFSEQTASSNNGSEQAEKKTSRKHPCLFLAIKDEQLGLFVEELLEELEVVLKPPGALLKRVRNVSGVTILGSGEVCVVLNPFDLMKTVQKQARMTISPVEEEAEEKSEEEQKKSLVLLAEDSITTRTQEKRILEGAGYEVVTAVDGLAAFNVLPTRPFDALISDIEMPNMTGLALAEKVRQNKAYQDFPIILVSSLSTEEDKKRGMEVGADAYITKSAFNQNVLLDTLRRLI
ncbi:MAG: hybrid sensor histidine kinase/response regulator [Gammaproteobacteria bacterium]|nr:hybrid sensor histidine kinase/response regulator [Gammaproteobacteria bacterium]